LLPVSVALLLLFIAQIGALTAATAQPAITDIRLEGGQVVVVVRVPPGLQQVTLQSRSRLGEGAWVHRAVERPNGSAGSITFRLPQSPGLELFRVRGDAEVALSGTLFQGATGFQGAPSSSPDAILYRNGFDALGSGAPGTPAVDAPRAVQESDIWKIQGDRLFFFNQYRGLQVIDIADASAPVLRGALELAAAGEQLHLLGDRHVVLLARDDCQYDAANGQSQILVVRIDQESPAIVARQAVPGSIQAQENRLVGSVLYLTSQVYRPVAGDSGGAWESVVQVSSIDLAQPESPVLRDAIVYPGYSYTVMATDRFLFVASTSYSSRQNGYPIYCIDISDPTGIMRPTAEIPSPGPVQRKFNMNLRDDVFTTVTESSVGSARTVSVHAYSMQDPFNPRRLGRLDLVTQESLTASLFEGTRLYVVTFLRVDPLWVVDLADPSQPVVLGELTIPGWSTYLHPLGDRLVAVGTDNTDGWRVAVSLFNVQDPTRPSLMSKVLLGQNWSSSEANFDEKAFNVLPPEGSDPGLILVPYQGDYQDGYASRVQLIDLRVSHTPADRLEARGVIEHRTQARRTAVRQNTILSISGQELLSVNAADRDHPEVTHSLELSWPVNRLFVAGDFLIEIADQPAASPAGRPVLRVAPAADPARVLRLLPLDASLPVAGAARQGDRLYIAQTDPSFYYYVMPLADPANPSDPPARPIVLTVLDLAQLPDLSIAGSTTANLGEQSVCALRPLWPKPGLLVWQGSVASHYWWRWDSPLVGIDLFAPSMWRGWYGGDSGRLLAFDVADPAQPRLASDLNLAGNSWWNFSPAVAANGCLFLSHQASEFLEGVLSPYTPAPVIRWDPVKNVYVTEIMPPGTWVQKDFLDVIDYTDPAHPEARAPVNIPGRLQGISHVSDLGALLYTAGPHWNADWTTDWTDFLDVCAYDGVSASWVAAMPLSKEWPHPVAVHEGFIYIGAPDSASQGHRLETWTLDQGARKLVRAGSVEVSQPVSAIAGFDSLLVSQSSMGDFTLWDQTDPARLESVGAGQPPACYGANLDQADGRLDGGLWLPMGDYGVRFIPAQP